MRKPLLLTCANVRLGKRTLSRLFLSLLFAHCIYNGYVGVVEQLCHGNVHACIELLESFVRVLATKWQVFRDIISGKGSV